MELQSLAYNEKPEVIVITEILPKHTILDKIQDHEWQLEGYNHITSVSENWAKARGIILYSKKTISMDNIDV